MIRVIVVFAAMMTAACAQPAADSLVDVIPSTTTTTSTTAATSSTTTTTIRATTTTTRRTTTTTGPRVGSISAELQALEEKCEALGNTADDAISGFDRAVIEIDTAIRVGSLPEVSDAYDSMTSAAVAMGVAVEIYLDECGFKMTPQGREDLRTGTETALEWAAEQVAICHANLARQGFEC